MSLITTGFISRSKPAEQLRRTEAMCEQTSLPSAGTANIVSFRRRRTSSKLDLTNRRWRHLTGARLKGGVWKIRNGEPSWTPSWKTLGSTAVWCASPPAACYRKNRAVDRALPPCGEPACGAVTRPTGRSKRAPGRTGCAKHEQARAIWWKSSQSAVTSVKWQKEGCYFSVFSWGPHWSPETRWPGTRPRTKAGLKSKPVSLVRVWSITVVYGCRCVQLQPKYARRTMKTSGSHFNLQFDHA